jgi:hypothetical protein
MTNQTKHDRIFLHSNEEYDHWRVGVAYAKRNFEDDVEYIRADIMAEQLAELLKEANQQLAAKDAAIKISLDTLKFILRYGVLDKSQMVREAIAAIDNELGK